MFKLQHKVDHLWDGLMMSDGDGARVARVSQAMMTMSKFDIAALQRAYDGA